MEFKKFMNLGIKLEEGVLITKFIMPIHTANEENVYKIKDLLENHKYTINVVPGEFLKIFSMNSKEVEEFGKVLIEIDELGLKDIFNANLKAASFKRSFLEKLKFCINHRLPYLNSDNTFIKDLYDNEKFGEYSAKVPLAEIKTAEEIKEPKKNINYEETESKLDAEDLMVKTELIKTLTEINQENDDMTLKFIVSTIITNIDSAITKDNKKYRLMGTRHIIEDALQGFNMTPEIEDLVQNKILSKFTQEEEIQMGRLA